MGATTEKTHFLVQVGSKGRVVLPAEVREALHLKEGERLLLTLEPEGGIRVEPLRKVVEETYGILGHLAPGVSLVEELIRERREEARKEEAE
ncbi:AbrB/MazE/SpoVT family DNA-binding domain-containing protein [Thermus altitudinis]|uniref:AbrB/MazE/SpoVT family DNA-binding domain-containing protein n=1 Tax=Thermus altitudinis TaxID=2908145 RepID=UPI001FAA2C2F|nr:AbrB/MazE/SpoVT family DNA-binding domain-containing protein [Thermus altitudinis]